MLLADLVYDVPANVILDSARRALSGYDVITSCIKAWVFGLIISTVRGRGDSTACMPTDTYGALVVLMLWAWCGADMEQTSVQCCGGCGAKVSEPLQDA